MIAVQYNIQKTSDWKRITISMIRNLGGQVMGHIMELTVASAIKVWT